MFQIIVTTVLDNITSGIFPKKLLTFFWFYNYIRGLNKIASVGARNDCHVKVIKYSDIPIWLFDNIDTILEIRVFGSIYLFIFTFVEDYLLVENWF
jgi:hypothetical protein